MKKYRDLLKLLEMIFTLLAVIFILQKGFLASIYSVIFLNISLTLEVIVSDYLDGRKSKEKVKKVITLINILNVVVIALISFLKGFTLDLRLALAILWILEGCICKSKFMI